MERELLYGCIAARDAFDVTPNRMLPKSFRFRSTDDLSRFLDVLIERAGNAGITALDSGGQKC